MKVNAQCDILQATANDPRKTRIGEFIRKTSIDELPQFINVLKEICPLSALVLIC